METHYCRLSIIFVALTSHIGGCGADAEKDSGDTGESDSVITLPDGGVASERRFITGGLSKPESALYDELRDVILVSNINGGASEVDDNGFISRVETDGSLRELKWIDGQDADVALDAPKGMGILNNILYVADITLVRLFDIETGAPLSSIKIAEAVFLNDIAADDTRVFVSDSSGGTVFEILSDASYVARIATQGVAKPNGLALFHGTLYAVDQLGNITGYDEAFRIVDTIVTGAESLDGIVALSEGHFLVSSWGEKMVFIATKATPFTPIVAHLPSPADIGLIQGQNVVLIPTFGDNTLIGEHMRAGFN